MTPGGRIDDIQFLRAVAIGMVLVVHSPALIGWYGASITAIEHYGAFVAGVDVFFAISGFVICRSFIQRNNGIPADLWPAARAFWLARAWRIFPPAWFWLAGGLFATAFLSPHGTFGDLAINASDGLAAFFQIANVKNTACALLLQVCAVRGVPFGIYWSLSLEEQFYLLFPFVLVLTPRRWLVPVLLLPMLTVFVRTDLVGVLFRFEGLGVGVILGLASFHPLYARLRPSFLEGWQGVTSLVMAVIVLVIPSPWLNLGQPAYIPLSLACGFWVFLASHGLAMPRSRLKPFLMWVGARSYTIYLCHFIVFCLTNEILWGLGGPAATPLYLGVAAFLLWLFAEGTYRFIESPAQQRAARVRHA